MKKKGRASCAKARRICDCKVGKNLYNKKDLVVVETAGSLLGKGQDPHLEGPGFNPHKWPIFYKNFPYLFFKKLTTLFSRQ